VGAKRHSQLHGNAVLIAEALECPTTGRNSVRQVRVFVHLYGSVSPIHPSGRSQPIATPSGRTAELLLLPALSDSDKEQRGLQFTCEQLRASASQFAFPDPAVAYTEGSAHVLLQFEN